MTPCSFAARLAAFALSAALLLCAAPAGATAFDSPRQLASIKKISLTPKATARPTKETLQYNDSGAEVKSLQKLLIKYGYLDGKVSGKYDRLTERAVLLFQLNNDLTGTGIADSQTQYRLEDGYYSKTTATNSKLRLKLSTRADVSYYTCSLGEEFDLPPLVQYGWLNWTNLSNNRVKMRIKVTNVEQERTVDSFTITAWFEDPYGEEVGCGVEWDTRTKVKPGATVYSAYVVLSSASKIYTCHFAITRMHCTNGDIIYIDSEDWQYFNYTYDR